MTPAIRAIVTGITGILVATGILPEGMQEAIDENATQVLSGVLMLWCGVAAYRAKKEKQGATVRITGAATGGDEAFTATTVGPPVTLGFVDFSVDPSTDPKPSISVPDTKPPAPTLPNGQPVEPRSTTLWLRVRNAAWKVAPLVNRVRALIGLVRR